MADVDFVIQNLKDYRSSISALPKQITSLAANFTEKEIKKNIGTSIDDGNEAAYASSVVKGNNAVVSMRGSQAAFLEFGTGLKGDGTYPLGRPWKYAVGVHVHMVSDPKSRNYGKLGWEYYSLCDGRWKFTEGILAQAPVYKAADTVRKNIFRLAKACMRGEKYGFHK